MLDFGKKDNKEEVKIEDKKKAKGMFRQMMMRQMTDMVRDDELDSNTLTQFVTGKSSIMKKPVEEQAKVVPIPNCPKVT